MVQLRMHGVRATCVEYQLAMWDRSEQPELGACAEQQHASRCESYPPADEIDLFSTVFPPSAHCGDTSGPR